MSTKRRQPSQPLRCDLVLEGGGVKGIALVGALAVLEEHGYEPQNIAGTSIGAIVATLLAAGYHTQELRRIIGGINFNQFMDTGWEDRIPLVGLPMSVLLDLGMFEGDYFLRFMRRLLEAKGIHTFGDLVHPVYADDPRYRYRVQVIASDLTDRRLLILPQDAERLGVAPDDFDVALAVRMSMSIPIFFDPVRFREPKSGREHVIVDGGLLSNFPIWLFDAEGAPEWPTFGLHLVEPFRVSSYIGGEQQRPIGASGATAVIDYLQSLVLTALQARDWQYIERGDFARTVPIPTLGIGVMDFGIKTESLNQLYLSGRKAAREFLRDWDFDGYVAGFRSGQPYSRRASIVEQMQRCAAEALPVY